MSSLEFNPYTVIRDKINYRIYDKIVYDIRMYSFFIFFSVVGLLILNKLREKQKIKNETFFWILKNVFFPIVLVSSLVIYETTIYLKGGGFVWQIN